MHDRQIWPPVMVFSWRWLFYSAVAGASLGVVPLALSDTPEGVAVALGVAFGMGIWLGYPLGLRVAVVLLWPVHRLLHMTRQRIDWVASEHQLVLPEPAGSERLPVAVKLVAPALYLYAGAAVVAVIAVLCSGFLLMAGLDATWNASAVLSGTAIAAYAYMLSVTLWLRGRTEILARALRQGTQRASRVAFSVNRRLHLV